MTTSMTTFLFNAFHGGYTGGVCVVQANTREEAIELVATKFRKQLVSRKITASVTKRINEAYHEVFPEKDYNTGNTPVGKEAKRFKNPTEEWQRLWNRLLPFPKEDPWIGGRVIYEKLVETLPDPEEHICFGTWTEGGRIQDVENDPNKWYGPCDLDENDEAFILEVRKELEECTFKNGRCVRLNPGFVVLQGGGT